MPAPADSEPGGDGERTERSIHLRSEMAGDPIEGLNNEARETLADLINLARRATNSKVAAEWALAARNMAGTLQAIEATRAWKAGQRSGS